MSSNNAAPDSWESQADSQSPSAEGSPQHNSDADVTTAKFSTLNVNAVEFVPSFACASSPQPEDGSPEHSPILNGEC